MSLTLPGPAGPIEYHRDDWGYPTIHARNASEGVWARAYLQAVDRPLQVALTIRAAEGRLMETIGEQPFTRIVDRTIRSLGFTADLDAQVAAIPPHVRSFMQTYCDGFNAGRASQRRPPVARILGLEKRPYTVRDVVLLYRMLGWFGLTSTHHTAALVLGQLLAGGANREAVDLLLGEDGKHIDLDAFSDLQWPEADGLPGLNLMGGSNCFAVNAARSKTGSALLMTEFHMEIARLPPVLWAFSVQFPGGEHTGVSLPGMPFISAGRTTDLAWGFTFGHVDMFGLTVERCRRGQRRTADGWEPMRRRDEVVVTGRGKTETWTYWDFDGGSVIGHAGTESEETPRAALRWRGLRDTAGDLELFWEGMKLESAEQAAKAHRRVKGISLAGTFADKKGHIAYAASGRRPAGAKGWTVHSPEVADGPDTPDSERPFVSKPASGYIASANEPHPGWTAFPEPHYRHQRLCELLEGEHEVGPDDLAGISYDELDGCGRRLCPVWAPLLPDDERARAMSRWSGGGSKQSDEDRDCMRLFHALHRELLRELVSSHLGDAPAAVFWDELDLLLPFQERLDAVLALEVPEHLDAEGLRAIIDRAWPEACRRADDDRTSGPVTTRFKNLVTAGALPAWVGFSTPPVRLPGGPTSVFQARRTSTLGETLVGGPAFHLLIDLSRPGLRYNMAGGASGRRFGPGYGKGVDALVSGDLAELPSKRPSSS